MRIALTGATGFVGSHILAELQSNGHDVTALVRDDAQAATVSARGATPAVVDLYDRLTVVRVFREADGAVHTASPGHATSANLDFAVADAAIEAFSGSGKPYVPISGAWVFGSNPSITEESPFNAPALVAWREPIEHRVLGRTAMRGVVITSSTAYAATAVAVSPGSCSASPRDADGKLIMLGNGRQHWPEVHVADLALAFRLVLENQAARGILRHRQRPQSHRRGTDRSRCRRRRRSRGGLRVRRRGAHPPR